MHIDTDTSTKPIVTVADLIRVVREHPDTQENKRRVVLSNLKRFCEIIGKAPERVVLDADNLRPTLSKQRAAKYGFSKAHWQNILCHVRWAGRLAGLEWFPGRNRTPMSPAWERLYELAQTEEGRGLSKLFRYCSQHGLEPEQVDDAVIATYWEKLSESSLAKDPYPPFRRAAVLWNRMGEAHGAWPAYRFTIEDRRRRRNLSWDHFPASFKRSVEAWAEAVSGDRVLLFESDLAHPVLAPRTIETRKYQILTLASACVRTGIPVDLVTSMENLADPDVFKAGLQQLYTEFGGKTPWLDNIARGFVPIAEHYLRVDPDRLAALKEARKRVAIPRHYLKEKNRDRLRALDDPRQLERLLWLSDRVIGRIEKITFPTRHDAVRVQTALAVDILIYTSLRLGNLTALDPERHLRWTGTGRRRALSIVIPAAEVKNEVDLDFPVPKDLQRKIALFIGKYRLQLAPTGSPWLFPGRDPACHKGQSLFGTQISNLILEETGLEFHPHLFRHLAAKIHLRHRPGEYAVIQQHLGHKDINTTLNAYAAFEKDTAIRHYQAGVLEIKNGLEETRQ